jgi:ribonuclease G
MQIRVDSAENFERLNRFAETYTPNLVGKLTLHRGERALFDLFDVDAEINKALGRRVDLKSGGYLMIDQTESMTTIDVNTGSYVGARNLDDTVFKTNLEAAQAIARQLRLRNLGGIIIIDFIDMLTREHQEAVLSELKRNLERDHARNSVSQLSDLVMVEMTRKRTRESLSHMLCEPCPSCEGKGIVKTTRTVVYDILREILREARQFNPREFRVVAAPGVIELLLDEESQHLAALSDFIAKPISLQSESAMGQDQYDVVLL